MHDLQGVPIELSCADRDPVVAHLNRVPHAGEFVRFRWPLEPLSRPTERFRVQSVEHVADSHTRGEGAAHPVALVYLETLS